MKKKQIKRLILNKKLVSSFEEKNIIGGTNSTVTLFLECWSDHSCAFTVGASCDCHTNASCPIK